MLDHLRWPRRLPYDTMDGLWTAPGVEQFDLYQRLSGHPPPYTKSEWDSLYIGVLNHYGNPEFNSQSGYAGAFVDFGHFGGIVYFLFIGVIAGLLYRGFTHGRPPGLFLYPLVFVGLLELPRYIYWSYGRTIYAWLGLLIVIALVSRSEAKERHQKIRKTSMIAVGLVAVVAVGLLASSVCNGAPATDSAASLQAQLDAVPPGGSLTLEPRTYTHADVIKLRVPGVSIDGNGATLEATNDATSAVQITADGVQLANVTLKAPSGGKRWSSLDQPSSRSQAVDDSVSQVTIVGSAASGIAVDGARGL